MNDKIGDYLAAQKQEVISFRQALTFESDRGCALFAAAYLNKSLSDLLCVSLVENQSIEQDLFGGTAPLSTFSSKITIAYYLGLISANCRRDLDVIRSIRNDFADHPEIISFETQSIRERCRSLSFSYHQQEIDPRSHFTAAVMLVLGHIHIATLTTTPHTEKPDDSPSEEEKQEHQKRIDAIKRMRGLLKTDQPAPTDSEVAAMLEERRAEKYLL